MIFQCQVRVQSYPQPTCRLFVEMDFTAPCHDCCHQVTPSPAEEHCFAFLRFSGGRRLPHFCWPTHTPLLLLLTASPLLLRPSSLPPTRRCHAVRDDDDDSLIVKRKRYVMIHCHYFLEFDRDECSYMTQSEIHMLRLCPFSCS